MYLLYLSVVAVVLHSSLCDEPEAVANINVGTASGTVKFQYCDVGKCMRITGTIRNLTPGKHGFHIHQKRVSNNDCKSTGGHYNPDLVDHGAPTDEKHHVGDLGNIVAD